MRSTYQIVIALIVFLFVLFILLVTQGEALGRFVEQIMPLFR